MVMDINNDIMSEFDALSPLDYDQMKALGLEYIQKIAHGNWTDFNIHDPGVTIWEALCFSLSDLAYRTNFDIKDLLTKEGETHPAIGGGTLFSPDSILSSNPLTLDDYRKFVLENVKEAQNVWLYPCCLRANVSDPALRSKGITAVVVNGFYNVKVQWKEYVTSTSERTRLGKNLLDLLNSRRNLCEYFLRVDSLSPVDVGICLEIEVNKYSELSRVVRDIYNCVKEYISPSISHYTVSEMLTKGKSYEDIFQVFSLKNDEISRFVGFVDNEEVKSFDKRRKLYLSDVLNLIMKVDGVSAVTHFHFVLADSSKDQCVDNAYYVQLKEQSNSCYFRLSPLNVQEGTISLNEIRIRKGPISIPISFQSEELSVDDGLETSEEKAFLDLPAIESRFRDVSHYYSFQNILPKCYKVGKGCLSKYDAPMDIAKANQLKGYLALFDQFLSDYLVQLGSLSDFFSVEREGEDPNPSWFHGCLSDDEVENISKIVKLCDEKGPHCLKYKSTGFSDFLMFDRKTIREKTLDHLLARFNESFPEYDESSMIYDETSLEFNMLQEKLHSQCLSLDVNLGNESEIDREAFVDKKELLKLYPGISQNRSRSYCVEIEKDPKTGRPNKKLVFSGVEKRILSKLGVNNFEAYGVRMTNSSQTGENETPTTQKDSDSARPFTIHVLEHILFFNTSMDVASFLEMTKDPSNGDLVTDPYSFHVTVILPGWLDFTCHLGYREFVENVIREEMPAHIVSKICWVSYAVMKRVEDMLEKIYLSDNPLEVELRRNIKEIKQIFSSFKNVYPMGESLDVGTQRIGFLCLPDDDSVEAYTMAATAVNRASSEQVSSVVQRLNKMPTILQEVMDSLSDDVQSEEEPAPSVAKRSAPAASTKKSSSGTSKKEKSTTNKNAKKTTTKKTSGNKKK